MMDATITSVPSGSALLGLVLQTSPGRDGPTVHFAPDVAGVYQFTCMSQVTSFTAPEAGRPGLVWDVTVFRRETATTSSTTTPTAQRMRHQLAVGVDLVVGISNGAIATAILEVKDRTNKALLYASEDAEVKAAVAALVGADIGTVADALNNTSPLMAAWRAAFTDTTPEVQGVDPSVAALTLRGWSTT